VVTGGHDHEPTFYAVFEGDARISANINPHPGAYRGDLRKRVDVLVLYDMVQEISEAERKNLQTFLESGRGMVVLHHAIANYNSWRWWWEEVVGGRYLLKPDGAAPASTYRHDEEMVVEPAAKHAITAGVGPMHLWDETYKGMWISPKSTVLLRTGNPTSDGPVAWISPYRQSRVVYIELGHGSTSHTYPPYRRLVTQAILWAAGRE
jgi:type 1 glutamine amidotransferase